MSLFFSLFPCKSFHTFSLLYLTSFLLNQKKSMYVLTCLTLISVHVISLIFSICVPHVFHIFCWSFTSCPSCLYIYICSAGLSSYFFYLVSMLLQIFPEYFYGFPQVLRFPPCLSQGATPPSSVCCSVMIGLSHPL